jgi:hypothetical protein
MLNERVHLHPEIKLSSFLCPENIYENKRA